VWGFKTVGRTCRKARNSGVLHFSARKSGIFPTPGIYPRVGLSSQQDSLSFSLFRTVIPVPNCDTGRLDGLFLVKTVINGAETSRKSGINSSAHLSTFCSKLSKLLETGGITRLRKRLLTRTNSETGDS